MDKPIVDKLPKAKKSRLPEGERIVADRTLCQGMVPRALLKAAREEWTARGLTSGKFLQWALTEYLTLVNPERAQEVIDGLEYV